MNVEIGGRAIPFLGIFVSNSNFGIGSLQCRESELRIRIRMDPHYFWKLDPDLDPH